MYKILKKRRLNSSVTLMEIFAPEIAQKAKPGQFVMIRVDEQGERIPLTINDFNPETGGVTIVFQLVGNTTQLLDGLDEGDFIQDFTGPLGKPTHIDKNVRRACVVGGGVGCAIAYPQAKALFERGVQVDVIAGFRSKDIVILEDEMRAACTNLYITTDDGSYAEKGFVTDKLKGLIESGAGYDLVIAIGPVIMMKFVALLTKQYGIKTMVSLNPIMVDGTGMCGGCRVTVGGQTKFACVDGPDFDGHEVDFDELMRRNTFYKEQESKTPHVCRLTGEVHN
jgi:ferredoxin--NADP+ reductase